MNINILNNYIKYLKLKNYADTTINSYLITANSFLKFCNSKISKENFILFIKNNFKKRKPSTIRTKFNYLSNFLSFLEIDWFTNEFKNNFILPKLNNEPKVVLDKTKIKSILNNFNLKKITQFKKYLWVRILFETGLRASEFQMLRKDDISNTCRIYIIGKGYKSRTVFITEELYKIIQNWPYQYFCIDKNGNLVSTRQLRKTLKQIGNKFLNMNNLSPHMLRRSFCTNLIKNGCKLNVVQALMGHSSISTTSKYIFFSQEEMYDEYKITFDFL